jgi:hypothetical protein
MKTQKDVAGMCEDLGSIPITNKRKERERNRERDSEHEMYEVSAGIAWHTILQFTFFNKQKLYSLKNKYVTSSIVIYCHYQVLCATNIVLLYFHINCQLHRFVYTTITTNT